MAQKIFLIAGLTGVQKEGNQTMKNTIYYLAKSGFKIVFFTFLPKNYKYLPKLYDVFGELQDAIEYHSLPLWLAPFFFAGSFLKKKIGKAPVAKHNTELLPSHEVQNYFSEINIFARLVYLVFWYLYVILETPRVLLYAVREKPDIFYGYEVYGARVASIAGRISHKPVITRFQGTPLRIHEKRNWNTLYPHGVLGLKSKADAVIMANDGTLGNVILERLGVPKEKIFFWHNGVDINFVVSTPKVEQMKKKYDLNEKVVLLCVSKLLLWKRVDRAVWALSTLKKTYGINHIFLLAVGDGTERTYLESLAKIYGIADSIHFAGAVQHEELGTYFTLADIFVILQDVSNLSNQVFEALSFGLPVVSLDDESTTGILKDHHNALLIPKQNIEAGVPRALAELIKDENMRAELALHAKETFDTSVLTWGKRMERERKLLNTLINHEHKTRH